jgi:uncharacterized protein YggE
MRTLTRLAPMLALLLLGGCATAAGPETRPQRLISVRGTGKVAVKPDLATVRVGVELRAPALADATADVGRRMSAVLERLKALGVAERDITTATYAIDPLAAPRRTDEDPVRIVGYRVANVVQVKLRDLAAVGRTLDGALAAGANTLTALSFTVDDPRPLQAQARVLAVQAAAATAQQLAAAAGVTLGELVSLTEGVVQPVVARMAAPMMAAGSLSAGPVQSGELEISVSVEAHYRLTP